MSTIETAVAPTTWDEVGGPGSITISRESHSLVISQTQEVHEEVIRLLAGHLRKARDVQDPAPPVTLMGTLRIERSEDRLRESAASRPLGTFGGGTFFKRTRRAIERRRTLAMNMARFAIALMLAGLLFGGWACPLWLRKASGPTGPHRLGAPAQIVAAEQVRRALWEPAEINCDQVPLADALADLAGRHHVRFDIDQPALADARVEPDTPVTLRAKGLMLQSALRLLLDPVGLTCLIRNSGVLITTQGRTAAMLSIAVYPIADLAIAWQGDPRARGSIIRISPGARDILTQQCERRGGQQFAFSSLAEARALVAIRTRRRPRLTAAFWPACGRRRRSASRTAELQFDPGGSRARAGSSGKN